MAHFVLAAGAQSNMANGISHSFTAVPSGCKYVQNGVVYNAGDPYATKTNCVPKLLEELVANGHTADVYERSQNGISLVSWMDNLMPLLFTDTAGLMVDSFLWVQGENESRTENAARPYLARFVGPRIDGPSLYQALHEEYGLDIRFLILELRHRDAGYGKYHQAIRAAHILAGEMFAANNKSVCMPSHSIELLPANVHFSRLGHDTLGIMTAHELMTPGSSFNEDI